MAAVSCNGEGGPLVEVAMQIARRNHLPLAAGRSLIAPCGRETADCIYAGWDRLLRMTLM